MAVLAEQVDDGVVDIPSADEDSPSNCDSDARWPVLVKVLSQRQRRVSHSPHGVTSFKVS